MAAFCFFSDVDRLRQPNGRVGHRHEHQVALVQRRHELPAESGYQRQRAGQNEGRHAEREQAVTQCPAEHRPVEPHQRPHHGTALLAANAPADQQAGEHRHESHRQQRGAGHGEGLGKGQRTEELALLARQSKHRDEGQHDDQHREKDRTSHHPASIKHGGQHSSPIARIDAALLHEAEAVLGHDDRGVHEDPDSDGDPGERHDVGADLEIAHEEKGDQHGQRKRDGHDKHRADIQQEQDVDQRDDDRLLDQRPSQRAYGSFDER
jgi:hypothetical protein